MSPLYATTGNHLIVRHSFHIVLDPQNACQQLGLCTSFVAKSEIVADLEKMPIVEGTSISLVKKIFED
jgi:hypothetical protein